MKTLRQLNAEHHYQTDKLGLGGFHDYTDSYERHFGPLQNLQINFWEIGVQRGDSIRMWSDYFPSAKIVGIDKDKPQFSTSCSRVLFRQCDINDANFPGDLMLERTPPYVVLDDGSHKASDMGVAFEKLWPHVRIVYAIEDLGTQYKAEFLDAVPFTERVKYLCSKIARREDGSPSRIVWEPGIVFIYK